MDRRVEFVRDLDEMKKKRRSQAFSWTSVRSALATPPISSWTTLMSAVLVSTIALVSAKPLVDPGKYNTLTLVSASLYPRCSGFGSTYTLEKSLGFEGVYVFGNRVERRSLQKPGPSSKIQLGSQQTNFLKNEKNRRRTRTHDHKNQWLVYCSLYYVEF